MKAVSFQVLLRKYQVSNPLSRVEVEKKKLASFSNFDFSTLLSFGFEVNTSLKTAKNSYE